MKRGSDTRNWLRALGAALLALVGSGAQADAQPVAADHAPQAWVAYAQQVSQRFQAALEGDTEAAQRFHAFFTQHAASDVATSGAAAESPPPMLSVKAWVDGSGRIVRVEFASLGSEEAEADLRTLLLEQSVGASPPRGMRQPVVVRMSLAAQL